MHTPATLAIQRKLERWELEHLRSLVAEKAERIEELERRLEWAEDSAEQWRCNALDLAETLANKGNAVGLTEGGRIVAVKS